jgi:hypothetical protein
LIPYLKQGVKTCFLVLRLTAPKQTSYYIFDSSFEGEQDAVRPSEKGPLRGNDSRTSLPNVYLLPPTKYNAMLARIHVLGVSLRSNALFFLYREVQKGESVRRSVVDVLCRSRTPVQHEMPYHDLQPH